MTQASLFHFPSLYTPVHTFPLFSSFLIFSSLSYAHFIISYLIFLLHYLLSLFSLYSVLSKPSWIPLYSISFPLFYLHIPSLDSFRLPYLISLLLYSSCQHLPFIPKSFLLLFLFFHLANLCKVGYSLSSFLILSPISFHLSLSSFLIKYPFIYILPINTFLLQTPFYYYLSFIFLNDTKLPLIFPIS